MSGLSEVSISFTSAVVYAVSGLIFALLIFLLVLMGISNCDCKCSGFNINCWKRRSRKSVENLPNHQMDIKKSMEMSQLPGLPSGPAKPRLGPAQTTIDLDF